MTLLRPVLIAAAAGALLAALVLTMVQSLWITPLILRAETYEDSAATHGDAVAHSHDAADAAAADGHSHQHVDGHHHDHSEWKPENGWQRTLFTLAANIALGFGYALILAGLCWLWRAPDGVWQGLLVGACGFLVFFVAPGLGLPPELPGTAAAELGARQHWWLATVGASAVGGALLVLQRRWWARALGLALLLAPHLVGAPQPDVEASLAPATLQTQFRIATTVANALFWLLLGATFATALRRSAR